ncbi:acyltransferase family protein [Parabacteroides sp. Marseille-P3160]|uniref:acyltransferase family protein n=1 Tax=Parabacteroides sp. Marseille-P3160 TaxID=1917887 RepID=UPI0009BB5B40|nr:acyltransferase family protein [Parabacteroides sp. Marseille-P3160]
MASQKHYVWVDYAKFLSIFLVVYFHAAPRLEGLGGASLHLLRMPCFFFLAGLLFRADKYPTFRQYVTHRSKQIILPYFCFFILFYACWLVIGKTMGTPEYLAVPFYQPVLEYLRGVPRLICLPLWFIPCLFAIQCTFYLVFRRMKRLPATFILLLFPFVNLFVDLVDTPCSLDMLCKDMPFYGIASLYRKEIFQFMEKGNHLFIGLVSLGVHLLLSYVFIGQPTHLQAVLVELFGSFLILLPVFILVKWISDFFGKVNIIEYMANNTIVILAFHTYSIAIIMRVIMWHYNVSADFFEGKYLLKLIVGAIAMASMIIPIWFINKYTPFVLGKKRA